MQTATKLQKYGTVESATCVVPHTNTYHMFTLNSPSGYFAPVVVQVLQLGFYLVHSFFWSFSA